MVSSSDVDLDGLATPEVPEDVARVERTAVDEEARAQVVPREGGDVRAQRRTLVRRRPRISRDSVGADAVVAGEAVAALRGRHLRLRLGGVVQQRAEPQPARPRQLVGERLGQERRDPRAEPVVAEDRGRVALELDGALEHLERVAVGVAVVVDGLLHAAERQRARAGSTASAPVPRQPARGRSSAASAVTSA